MSRHELPCRLGEHQLVIGYDVAGRTFYGQLFNHRDEDVEALRNLVVSGWPGRGGPTGMEPQMRTEDDAGAALHLLFAWLGQYRDLDQHNLGYLRRMLFREWRENVPRGHERFIWAKFGQVERV